MIFWWFISLTCALSWFFTRFLLQYAVTKNLIDIPNERSSHTAPTPRGGGIGFVLLFLVALPILTSLDLVSVPLSLALWGAGSAVAVTGFLDDHNHIAARWRLLVHFTAAAWGLYWLGGFPPIAVFGYPIDLGWFGTVCAALLIVWLLNLYNFMDGIDGIASVEAITVCCSAAWLTWLAAPDSTVWLLPIMLASAVLGFLFWNFPPARIFMGDAGSGFLGLTIALLSVQAAWIDNRLFWAWLILLAVFMVDATVTLCRRVFRGEKFYEAHRSHAYQYASRRLSAHRPVTLAIGAINLFWLLPIASLVVLMKLDGITGLIVAYLPLVLLAYRYKAGDRYAQA